MALYEIYHPDLEIQVKFRVKGLDDQELFRVLNEELPADAYRQAVLEGVIYNFKSEVVPQMRKFSKEAGLPILDSLYNHCVMLHPALDLPTWFSLGRMDPTMAPEAPVKSRKGPQSRAQKAKYLNLGRFLNDEVIGQTEAVESVTSALRRSFAGLGDQERPIGVFLFAGSSGVGKTLLAKKLNEYLYENKTPIIRVDCGEYQQKHENQKLIGSPPGYAGHEEGGQLTNQIINNPESIVLLDEVEKAHPDVMNTFLRVFDEGILTDSHGRRASFRQAIIIMTTNLGNMEVVNEIVGRDVGFGKSLYTTVSEARMPARDRVERLADEEIRRHFKPELLNRIDEIVVFNHLGNESYRAIAESELELIGTKLSKRGYKAVWSEEVIDYMVKKGTNPITGARGLERLRRSEIEDLLAEMLLDRTYTKGTTFMIALDGDSLKITVQRKKAAANGS